MGVFARGVERVGVGERFKPSPTKGIGKCCPQVLTQSVQLCEYPAVTACSVMR